MIETQETILVEQEYGVPYKVCHFAPYKVDFCYSSKLEL